MRHDGGDKIMAQVLNCVSSHGLEEMLVAVELGIESGVLSTEHLSTVADSKTSNPPWVNIGSAGWVNIQSAPTITGPVAMALQVVFGLLGKKPALATPEVGLGMARS